MFVDREPNFELVDDEWISITKPTSVHKYNFKLRHGISPKDYIQIYKNISSKYNLNAKDDFPKRYSEKVTLFGTEQEDVQADLDDYPVEFILNLSDLDNERVDVSPLIKEFRGIGNIDDLRHTCSLAFITAAYTLAGYKIEFIRKKKGQKTPDFYINGLSADLKVRRGMDLGREFLKRSTNTFQLILGEELCIDVGRTIQNRVYDGIKQAEVLFVDLDNGSLPFVVWDRESKIKGSIPEPKEFRILYFCKTKLYGDSQRYPLSATYLDFDPKLWEFIKTSDNKVIWTQKV